MTTELWLLVASDPAVAYLLLVSQFETILCKDTLLFFVA